MKQQTYEALLSRTTEELFFYFKHDGGIDFNKRIAAGKILHERKYNAKQLKREKDLIVESIKKDIAGFEDKSGLQDKINKQNKMNTLYSILKALPLIGLLIYLYIQEINERDSNQNTIIIGIILLIAMAGFNIYKNRKKYKELIISAQEDNKTQKQKLEVIDKDWDF